MCVIGRKFFLSQMAFNELNSRIESRTAHTQNRINWTCDDVDDKVISNLFDIREWTITFWQLNIEVKNDTTDFE